MAKTQQAKFGFYLQEGRYYFVPTNTAYKHQTVMLRGAWIKFTPHGPYDGWIEQFDSDGDIVDVGHFSIKEGPGWTSFYAIIHDQEQTTFRIYGADFKLLAAKYFRYKRDRSDAQYLREKAAQDPVNMAAAYRAACEKLDSMIEANKRG